MVCLLEETGARNVFDPRETRNGGDENPDTRKQTWAKWHPANWHELTNGYAVTDETAKLNRASEQPAGAAAGGPTTGNENPNVCTEAKPVVAAPDALQVSADVFATTAFGGHKQVYRDASGATHYSNMSELCSNLKSI